MYLSKLAFQYILKYQFKVCLSVERDNSGCTMLLLKIAFCEALKKISSNTLFKGTRPSNMKVLAKRDEILRQ